MDRILGVPELAEHYHVTEDTIRLWHRTRTGPPTFKIGRKIFGKESALTAYEDEQMAQAADG